MAGFRRVPRPASLQRRSRYRGWSRRRLAGQLGAPAGQRGRADRDPCL